jgi:excisionase family DNA binding protein
VKKAIQHQGLLNVEQFAMVTGWSPATVRMKVWRREIEFVRMGRSIRFRPEIVQRLIEENTVPAQTK